MIELSSYGEKRRKKDIIQEFATKMLPVVISRI